MPVAAAPAPRTPPGTAGPAPRPACGPRQRAVAPLVATLVVAALLPLAACKTGPRAADRGARADADGGGPAPTAPSDPAADGLPRDRADRWYRIDAMIVDWDAVQQEGRDQDATALAGKIADEVDADYAALVDAARGRYGAKGEHLGVKALGFSRRREATTVLVETLRSRDGALVGNALIALKLRADPDTSLPPLIGLLRASFPEARAFAPLALANITLARERAGRPVEDALAEQAMTGLVGLVQDRDPFARLHAAKAMGALRRAEAVDFLVVLLRDDHVRIRLAAAVALERIGAPRAFPEVVRLLENIPPEQAPLVRDVLASYAERLQGRPLAAGEAASYGVSAIAWDRWYSRHAGASGRPAPTR